MMKSTGIVRKVDELGRIVVPKELRDAMNIPTSEGQGANGEKACWLTSEAWGNMQKVLVPALYI